MTNQSPLARRSAGPPTVPRGDVLGTYDSYPEAQAVVEKLSHAEFPIKQLAIIGNELTTVERVTGRMSYGRAALAGAVTGLWLGVFFGLVMLLFSPETATVTTVVAAALIGAGFGMLYGLASFAVSRRRRDFTSTHQVLARSYQIVVDPGVSHRAREILSRPDAGR
ncbi:hypothetical protein ABID92_002279 [Frigoribacterium sp. PvP120]|jgi:hypothetical protein|uniref:general stress protein n=1 Tax=Frigoribacterium TaxID=96492 RepID=UPI0006FC990A|nr:MULTISPECIES: general stress protein [Frigoribacterium]KQR43851.1 hypothetical protein ASF82_09615 [Frigoribacterium sp. Leaf164]MBD8660138.1 hypothetical protein [Frigoribacterium sp. CFBP 8754]MBD8726483.1 hypothetical protein [Frigoribacterium sp. CFBP 13707]MBP1242487.1 hypothetical protein [Frigoribacterium sp. PvP121]NII51363.1 hypothetical protein [Frigoribacterium endophyticum]